MDKYTFFYGTQAVEFKRPKVPEIVNRKGIKINSVDKAYKLKIKPSITRVVISNVHD